MNLLDQLRSRPFHTAEVQRPLYFPKNMPKMTRERYIKAIRAQCDRIGLESSLKSERSEDGRSVLQIKVKGLGSQIVKFMDDLEIFVDTNSIWN